MPNSIELRQQRARIVESMRALMDTAEAENRDLDGTEREEFDRAEADFRALGERITRLETQEHREAEMAAPIDGRRSGAPADPAAEKAAAQRTAFFRYLRRGPEGLAPEQRALVENADGQILVPEDLESEIYRSLPKLTIMRQLAFVRPTIRDRIRRRSLDEVTVGWGKLETADQVLTDSMPTTPTEDYSYVEDLYGLAKIGEDELDDTDVNLEAFVADSFSRALAEGEDTGFTIGTGHANKQPVGWATAGGGITALNGSGALADYSDATKTTLLDELTKVIYAVPAQARRNGAFIAASTTELLLATMKDGNGRRQWEPNVQAGRPNSLFGYPLYNQEDVPAVAASKLIVGFGDWKAGYRILDRLGMTVQRLVELYAEDGMIGFKVRRRVGGDVVRPDRLRILKTPAA